MKVSWKTTYNTLNHATDRTHGAYDPDFDVTLKGIRPDWFKRNLRELLVDAATAGEDRPKGNLGYRLRELTTLGSKSYDRVFHDTVGKLRPTWFEPTQQEDARAATKAQLLQLAASGL